MPTLGGKLPKKLYLIISHFLSLRSVLSRFPWSLTKTFCYQTLVVSYTFFFCFIIGIISFSFGCGARKSSWVIFFIILINGGLYIIRGNFFSYDWNHFQMMKLSLMISRLIFSLEDWKSCFYWRSVWLKNEW